MIPHDLRDAAAEVEVLDGDAEGAGGREGGVVTTALYLASEATTFTTGQILAVDGGFLVVGVNQ